MIVMASGARDNARMECRPGCGACCIAPSITSAIPGMPTGKPAGVRCVQLDERARCRLFGRSERPAVCTSLDPQFAMCGDSSTHAMTWLARLERATNPGPG
jgi:Fe-S-cluster containining protein